ncbi:hypothetical protein H5410_036455 [Solanum commersonii]|uniref:Uncharacterized protein n=1 Tax=Solanum commersonii TaxID=4109 RepID=A0A9J5Y5P1_SOLCO|nr:hypothetical protein H5410_036455 [Solanum commersonii]
MSTLCVKQMRNSLRTCSLNVPFMLLFGTNFCVDKVIIEALWNGQRKYNGCLKAKLASRIADLNYYP